MEDFQSDHWHNFVPLAEQLAHDLKDPDLKHQIVALSVRGSRVLGYGINQRRHAKDLSYFYDSLHAEADLIRRHGPKLVGARVYLYRFNMADKSPLNDQVLCAKPCLLCSHMLREADISRVVWVNNAGQVQSVRKADLTMMTENPSVLTRLFMDRAVFNGDPKTFVAQGYLATY